MKTTFVHTTVEYLGYKKTNGTIIADPDKTAVIYHWPETQTIKKPQQFFCLASYYNQFINNFVEIAARFISLVGKNRLSK